MTTGGIVAIGPVGDEVLLHDESLSLGSRDAPDQDAGYWSDSAGVDDSRDVPIGNDAASVKGDQNELEKLFAQVLSAVREDGSIDFAAIGLGTESWTFLDKLDSSCTWMPWKLVGLAKGDGFLKYHPLLSKMITADSSLPLWTTPLFDHNNVMYTALQNKHEALVRFLCEKSSHAARKALRMKTTFDQNCLHLAVQCGVSIDLILFLIDFVDGDVVEANPMNNITANDKPVEEKVMGKKVTKDKVVDIPGPGGDTLLHLAVDLSRCRRNQSRIVEKILQISDKSLEMGNQAKMAPLRHLIHSREKNKAIERASPKKVAESDKIQSILMLQCLRLMRPRKDTMNLLYGSDLDNNTLSLPLRAISFDLWGYNTIRYDKLKGMLRHLVFEKFLQSVVLPDLTVEVLPVTSKRMEKSEDPLKKPPLCGGRIDYWWIFHWLRELKEPRKIQKILRVCVHDRPGNPHSDEVIERCLDGFGVEILNWNKPDICAGTIMAAAPGLRELIMHCSGNNGVLRAWAGPEGLADLPELKTLEIYVNQGFESMSRTTENVKRFEKEFQKRRARWCLSRHPSKSPHPSKSRRDKEATVCPEHEVHLECKIKVNDGKTTLVKPGIKPEERRQEEWIDCMRKYADFVQNIESEAAVEPIKVAIIDDGMDGLYANLSDNIVDGETWSNREGNDYDSYYKSSSGHGTVMATLIRRLCPKVQFYVARLDEHPTGIDNKMEITVESAVNAIKWAASKNVDIISMSWTLNLTDKKWIDEMEAAVAEAVKRRICLFCSISDSGSKNDGDYPAKCNRSRTFVIGSANAAGKEGEWNGDRDVDFIFPGIDLSVPTHDDLFDRDLDTTLSRTGSSLSTALAAGLAAVILFSVALNNKADLSLVRNHEGMMSAFKAVNNPTKAKSTNYIRVWDLFGLVQEGKDKKARDMLQIVVNKLLADLRK